MSVIITNNLDPNDVGTPSNGKLVLFSGPNNEFYYKKPTGQYFRISEEGFNTSLSFNTSSNILSIVDGGSTKTASLSSLGSGFVNTNLSFSSSNSVLSITDGFGTLTASLQYFDGGFNQTLSYNTSSNVLSLTDGLSTITASLTTGGANNLMNYNPFTRIISVTDGFGTVTASLSLLQDSLSSILTVGSSSNGKSINLSNNDKLVSTDGETFIYFTNNNAGTSPAAFFESGNLNLLTSTASSSNLNLNGLKANREFSKSLYGSTTSNLLEFETGTASKTYTIQIQVSGNSTTGTGSYGNNINLLVRENALIIGTVSYFEKTNFLTASSVINTNGSLLNLEVTNEPGLTVSWKAWMTYLDS
jgi:hypothetical protein